MATKSCSECGRVNGPTARRCMWCGLPIIDEDTWESFETTQIELDYLSGIERLDEPIPVRLIVGPSGLEVFELMPGSRRVLIPADSLLEAQTDTQTEKTGEEASSRRRNQISFRRSHPGVGSGRPHDSSKQVCILTIRFREGDEMRDAVFQDQEGRGQSSIDNIARTISMLIRWRVSQKDRTSG